MWHALSGHLVKLHLRRGWAALPPFARSSSRKNTAARCARGDEKGYAHLVASAVIAARCSRAYSRRCRAAYGRIWPHMVGCGRPRSEEVDASPTVHAHDRHSVEGSAARVRGVRAPCPTPMLCDALPEEGEGTGFRRARVVRSACPGANSSVRSPRAARAPSHVRLPGASLVVDTRLPERHTRGVCALHPRDAVCHPWAAICRDEQHIFL